MPPLIGQPNSSQCSWCWAAASDSHRNFHQLPPNPENTGKKCFLSVLELASLKCSVHTSQALDPTSTAQMSLPTAPGTPLLPRPCHHHIPQGSDYTSTLVLLSEHSTSLTTSNPSWGMFHPGRLVSCWKGRDKVRGKAEQTSMKSKGQEMHVIWIIQILSSFRAF